MLRYNLWNPFSFGDLSEFTFCIISMYHIFDPVFILPCLSPHAGFFFFFSKQNHDRVEFPKMASTEWDHFNCH